MLASAGLAILVLLIALLSNTWKFGAGNIGLGEPVFIFLAGLGIRLVGWVLGGFAGPTEAEESKAVRRI